MDENWLGEAGETVGALWNPYYTAYWDEWARMLRLPEENAKDVVMRQKYCYEHSLPDLNIDECVQHAQANLEVFQRWAAVLRLTGEL